MKTKLLLSVCLLAFVLIGCDQGDMSLPNDNTAPIATEYVLGKSFDEAKAYLINKGYTYAGVGYTEALHNFERGDKYPDHNDASEEGFFLWVFNDTVKSADVFRYFLNIRDALHVYTKWSNYTWRNICPNPLLWRGYIEFPIPEEEKTYGHYSDYHHFTDGTFTRQEGYDYGLDRKGFEKELNGLKEVLEIHEDYQRETNPKEMEMRLFIDEELGIFVEYENRNYIMQWESPTHN